MKILQLMAVLVLLLLNNLKIFAQEGEVSCPCFRPEYFAPIGVMMDHSHCKGTWMVSYRNMNMAMKNNMEGNSSIMMSDLLQNYPMANSSMNMNMNMLMVMYGITGRITIMGMGNYNYNTMNMSMNTSFSMAGHNHGTSNVTMESKSKVGGIGDTKLYLLYSLIKNDNGELLLSLGSNIPTGSISLKNNLMTSSYSNASYFMQPGTGSWGILPGLTYSGHNSSLSWGVQTLTDFKLNNNKSGYRFGNQYMATSWISHHWNEWLSNSVRIDGVLVDKIKGYDPSIAVYRTISPDNDAAYSGSFRSTVYAGVNLHIPQGALNGLSIACEFGIPFYQYVNGIQGKARTFLNTGIQYAF